MMSSDETVNALKERFEREANEIRERCAEGIAAGRTRQIAKMDERLEATKSRFTEIARRYIDLKSAPIEPVKACFEAGVEMKRELTAFNQDMKDWRNGEDVSLISLINCPRPRQRRIN